MIIKSSINGKKLPLDEVQKERDKEKGKIIQDGYDYIEYESNYGTTNSRDEIVEGYCYIIEAIEKEESHVI